MKTVDERRQRLNEVAKRGIRVPNGAYLSLEHDVPPPPVQEWSWWSHIWDRPSASNWDRNPSLLRSVQESWDKSEQFVTARLEFAAEREQRKTEAQRETDAADVARRQADADQLKAQLRDQYLSLPGTNEQDFEAALPDLLADHRRRELERLDQHNDEMRRELRRTIINNF